MAALPPEIQRRFEAYKGAPTAWDPVQGGRMPLVSWNDHVSEDLGPDPDGTRFAEISHRMLSGHYYPTDTIEFFGEWTAENREIRAGDRILQWAVVFPWPKIHAWAMTEVFAAQRTQSECTLGYVTTRRHFGRGVWRATLKWKDGRLTMEVLSKAGPGSWLFWLGLPLARHMQSRARKRAIEEFAKV